LALNEIRDPFGAHLDKINSEKITDNNIFVSLPRFWESDFHSNMTSLNVQYNRVDLTVIHNIYKITAYTYVCCNVFIDRFYHPINFLG